MKSLQEQLLNAGLITKQKARQANTQSKKVNKQKRSGVNVGVNLQEQIKQELQQKKAEKQAQDNVLNAQKQAQQLEKEKRLRIKQILEHHQIQGVMGETEYNYTFNGKIKKLLLDAQTHKALVNGRISLCGLQEKVYLVTCETADKIAQLEPSIILVKNAKQENAKTDEEDIYAQYQIPDDLMW